VLDGDSEGASDLTANQLVGFAPPPTGRSRWWYLLPAALTVLLAAGILLLCEPAAFDTSRVRISRPRAASADASNSARLGQCSGMTPEPPRSETGLTSRSA
jgi:hypothetical protein